MCLKSLTVLSYIGTHTHAYTNSSWRKSEHLMEKVYFTLGDLSYIIYTQKSLRGNHKKDIKVQWLFVPLRPKLYNTFCSLSSLPSQFLPDLIIKQNTWELKLFREKMFLNILFYKLILLHFFLLQFLKIFFRMFHSSFVLLCKGSPFRRSIHIWTWGWSPHVRAYILCASCFGNIKLI